MSRTSRSTCSVRASTRSTRFAAPSPRAGSTSRARPRTGLAPTRAAGPCPPPRTRPCGTPRRPGVLRQHVEAHPVHVQVERVVDQRPDRVLPEPLAPELSADADAELACAAEVVDPVEAGLPDQLAVHLDPEIGTI